ncbi:MAG TPA: hypothetical protein VFX20_17115 [Steroidobacteraceae bacterium]|nr:hypothetical protein [Steroidobacteraceae bacterium]
MSDPSEPWIPADQQPIGRVVGKRATPPLANPSAENSRRWIIALSQLPDQATRKTRIPQNPASWDTAQSAEINRPSE